MLAPSRPLSPTQRILIALTPVALIVVAAFLVADLVSQIPLSATPRHRAEAVCLTLAAPDPETHERFTPPMRIEPSAALVRGHFAPGTSAGLALREVMHLDESMVLGEWQRTVGDYAVSALWLDLPPGPAGDAAGGRHWLVLTWMEGADLAVCNFRFAGSGAKTTAAEREWADRLIARALVPANFKAGSLPRVRVHVAPGGAPLPAFGPALGS